MLIYRCMMIINICPGCVLRLKLCHTPHSKILEPPLPRIDPSAISTANETNRYNGLTGGHIIDWRYKASPAVTIRISWWSWRAVGMATPTRRPGKSIVSTSRKAGGLTQCGGSRRSMRESRSLGTGGIMVLSFDARGRAYWSTTDYKLGDVLCSLREKSNTILLDFLVIYKKKPRNIHQQKPSR